MPGYRPPSTEPRGKWAKRIHEKRRADGLSQTGAFELLGSRLGFGPKSRFSYVALDMGTREPTEHEAAVLAEWLGGYPSDEPQDALQATQTPDPVAAAIDRQTAALEALVDELLRWRTEDRARLDQVEAVLDELVAGTLGAPGTRESDDPVLPAGTAG